MISQRDQALIQEMLRKIHSQPRNGTVIVYARMDGDALSLSPMEDGQRTLGLGTEMSETFVTSRYSVEDFADEVASLPFSPGNLPIQVRD